MRRLVLEFSENNLDSVRKGQLQNIKTCEILHIFKLSYREFTAIIKVEFKDPSARIEDMLGVDDDLQNTTIQLLEQDRDGACIYFVKGKLQRSRQGASLSDDAYLLTPFELRNGKIKMTFLGNTKQIGNILEKISKQDLPYKVVSLTDAKFASKSPLNTLTAKQRMVLVSAFEQGYYETPRRINSQELSKKLHLRASTLVEHRRKAEQRLLSQIIRES